MPLRPTKGPPAESKPSAFPVLVCERRLPAGAARASVGGHTLPLLRHAVRRIVVVGDTGCVVQNAGVQACNDAAAWPFARLAAAAAAKPDLVIHVGDYHYRENACPDGNAKCRGSPWGYGWDAWSADFCTGTRSARSPRPGSSCAAITNRATGLGRAGGASRSASAGQWARDCIDAANDRRGDYSDPYVVPLSADMQLIVFDSSRVGVAPLTAGRSDVCNLLGAVPARDGARSRSGTQFFVDHHPILGFATDTTRRPAGVYPGNAALQSVLAAGNGLPLLPAGIDALLSRHDHLFEAVSFATGQPPQFIAGNGGTRLDEPLPRPLPPGRNARARCHRSRRSVHRRRSVLSPAARPRRGGLMAGRGLGSRWPTIDPLRSASSAGQLRAGGSAVKSLAMFVCLIAVCDACAQAPEPPRFSTAQPGAVPSGWQTVLLSASKQPTELRWSPTRSVVSALTPRGSASIPRLRRTDFDPRAFPTLSWRWKAQARSPAAEYTRRRRSEDSPARAWISFSGNRRR